jgi:hypothetical protein
MKLQTFNSKDCTMPNRITERKRVSDTTDDDSSNAAKFIIIQLQIILRQAQDDKL